MELGPAQKLGWKESKWRRPGFPFLFASDAEAGTWIADGNGFPSMRPALLYK